MGSRRAGPENERVVEVVYDTPVEELESEASARSVSTALIVAGIVVGLFALWLVSGLGAPTKGSGDSAAGEARAEPVLVAPTAAPTPTPTPVPTPTPSAIDEFVATRAANIARAQLISVGPEHSVAYRAVDGIGVLDFATGGTVTLDPELLAVSEPAAAEARELGFGADEFGMLARAATGDLVATTAIDGQLAVVNGTGTIFLQQPGVVPEELAVPPGAELRAIDTFGVIAFLASEGTLVPMSGGMELLTTGEVLAGNSVAWVERRCTPECQILLVDRATLAERALPETLAEEGSRYLVSPDGEAVLRVTAEGAGELYLAASGDRLWVNGSGIGEAAWAPDSSFVAWIDDTTEPVLKLMLPDRHDWVLVELGLLGAAEPLEGEIRVLASSPA